MQLTCIGHQSWSVTAGCTHLLIDPVLGGCFGSDPLRSFHIIPFRTVSVARMPAVDAIIFTTEHLQHFSPLTLVQLKNLYPDKLNTTRVYVPELIPQVARDMIQQCGFEVRTIDMQQDFSVGELDCRFYMPCSDVLFWDSRVASVYLRDSNRHALFIQSDTRIADSFYEDVNAGRVPAPNVMVVTNNFQTSAEGYSIGLDNLLPVADPKYARISGLRLLNEIVTKPSRRLEAAVTLLIAGNGYVDAGYKIRHLWSNSQLAQIASQLSLLRTVQALAPGERLEVGRTSCVDRAEWINLEEVSPLEVASIMPEWKGDQLSLSEVKAHLDTMAKTWLITGYGQVLMAQTQYLGRPLGARKLVIQLSGEGEKSVDFVMDISRVEFIPVESSGAFAIKQYPFGIRVDYRDFGRLIMGELQIWELINLSASQWYVCDRYDSPLAFWLEFYNEQVDYDRAARSYQLALASGS
ncbi:hypothetical protein PS862_04532 [Pseudomonas fluorescens]|uniref:Uncharacterized protein n=1 Tax=Pseudomonas fluorescens TaxID=294 RepID=A0A5E7NAJ5_PSEFL|nr:MBL fold metallo-hydrolase [Pseudomonas fluorescens]VVP34186.1 hypothetical protein PS862_04532 [Pseudomonas fluorescens]